MALVEPYPRTWVEIDLPALAHNLAEVRARLADERVGIALVTKADAYGHGLVAVSRYALRHGADWAAVATVQEGIALRDAGIDAPVMALSPILPVEAEQAVFYGLDVLTENLEIGEALSAASVSIGRPARLHLKVDTGLHRFGCTTEEAPGLADSLAALPGVKLVGIAQHFADSSKDPVTTRLQIERWQGLLAILRSAGHEFEVVQAANSAGAVRYPESRGNLVRIGIIGYGVDPFNLLEGKARPVLSWTSRVTAIRRVPAGEPIGYSGTFQTMRPSLVATVGVGYGDGYPRTLSNRGVVLIREREAQVVGLVCMDQLLIDVTDVLGVSLGDTVTLIGGSVTTARMAELAETNSHEIVTRIMSRVPRRYLY
jgi:alanine racemase